MKLIFKIGKVFLASQVLLGVAYASRNGVDLGRAHRIARRSIRQQESLSPSTSHSFEESPQMTVSSSVSALPVANLVRSRLARNIKRRRRNATKPDISFGNFPHLEESTSSTTTTSREDSSRDQGPLDASGLRYQSAQPQQQEIYARFKINKNCVDQNCSRKCNQMEIFVENADCFDCLSTHKCLDDRLQNSPSEESSTRSKVQVEPETASIPAETTSLTRSSTSSQIKQQSTLKNPVNNSNKNSNQQCISKCQTKNSCQGQDAVLESQFRQCSAGCHVTYDSIKEARECVNNLCTQELKPSCRTCLDVCNLETLVLGYYNHQTVPTSDETETQKREQLFISDILPKYQESVEDQEAARSAHESIDYSSLLELDSLGDESSSQVEQEEVRKESDSSEPDSRVRFTPRSAAARAGQYAVDDEVNTPRQPAKVSETLGDLVRNYLRPVERRRMYGSARAAIKNTILAEKRKKRDLLAMLM